MTHLCHADGCTKPVPPRLLMCLRHWRQVSPETRAAVLREYRPGQEIGKVATMRYLAVQSRAIAEVAFKPNDEQAAARSAGYILRAEIRRRASIEDGHGDPLEYTGTKCAIESKAQGRLILEGLARSTSN